MTQTEAFDAVQIISIKRDKGTLSPEQIDWTIDAYTRGTVADVVMFPPPRAEAKDSPTAFITSPLSSQFIP